MSEGSDREAVERVARGYFDAWFDGDTAGMDRVLHPQLVKRRCGEEMTITTKQRMIELTGQGEGKQDARDRTIEVEVTGLYSGMATATVRSAVYHEYLQLVRTSDGWRIANALWELRASG